MHVFFEDDGAFKAGSVLVDNDTSLQVESASGKRLKIKAASVLLRFADPGPSALLAEAQTLAATLDPGFLWEVSGEGDFSFADLAADYYGRAPRAAEAAALAMCLHASPMHFYKKGKGRYKAAPGDALKAALAGVERKRREAEQIEAYAQELRAHRLPPAFVDKLPMLLYKPDKQAVETRALAAACSSLSQGVPNEIAPSHAVADRLADVDRCRRPGLQENERDDGQRRRHAVRCATPAPFRSARCRTVPAYRSIRPAARWACR